MVLRRDDDTISFGEFETTATVLLGMHLVGGAGAGVGCGQNCSKQTNFFVWRRKQNKRP